MTSGELSIESGRQRVAWKVPGFLQLQLDASRDTTSPKIHFAGDLYHLRLHPTGIMRADTVYIALERSRGLESVQTPTVSCELRLKSRTGNEIELKKYSSGTIFKRCFQEMFFIERRKLVENRYSFVPDGTLTFICYMSVGEPSSAGGPHSEEEQEGLPGLAKLQSDYRQLLKKGAERDAFLLVSGKDFLAHRDILRARSPVFDAMYRHRKGERDVIDVINDLDPESFGEFLEYLYTGGVEAGLSDDNAFGLYSAADKYKVPTLKSECVAYMRRNLSVECFCDVMTVALRHNDEDLQQEAARFLKENIARIIVTPKWKKFVIDNATRAHELLIKAFVPGEQ